MSGIPAICVVCGKKTVGRIPKMGDGSLMYPRRHQGSDGKPCPGSCEEARWEDEEASSLRGQP